MAAGCQTVHDAMLHTKQDRQSKVHGFSLEYCKALCLGAFHFRNPYTDVGLRPRLAGVSEPTLFSLTESGKMNANEAMIQLGKDCIRYLYTKPSLLDILFRLVSKVFKPTFCKTEAAVRIYSLALRLCSTHHQRLPVHSHRTTLILRFHKLIIRIRIFTNQNFTQKQFHEF